MNDPYSVLGITRGATDREIKKAYREMSRKYHPDSYTDETEKKWAEEKFREVQEAYNQIVDERSGKTSGYGNAGGYGSSSQSYSEEDQHLMAAMNYINARRFNEAINVLNGMENRSARWYFFSSYANLGLGNNAVALDYAKKAVDMDPGNTQYTQYYEQLQAAMATAAVPVICAVTCIVLTHCVNVWEEIFAHACSKKNGCPGYDGSSQYGAYTAGNRNSCKYIIFYGGSSLYDRNCCSFIWKGPGQRVFCSLPEFGFFLKS